MSVFSAARKMANEYFSVEKCDKKTRRKIQIYLFAFLIFGYLFARYSPFVYLFHLLGFEHSNGCPLYTFTGIPCPTCGLGRSLSVILHQDFEKLFYYNPSAPFIYTILFVLIFTILIMSFYNYIIKLKPGIYKIWYAAVIITLVVWVLNILSGHIEI